MQTSTVQIQLGERSYPVHIGPGVITQATEEIRRRLGTRPTRAFVLHDAGVPRPHLDRLITTLEADGLSAGSLTITPTEPHKSIPTLERLLVAMSEHGQTRADPVVTLGGGIVGDLGGYAAASYQRGVPVLQCPTTLLAMVDASVGGKTGVNLAIGGDAHPRLLKNFVGAFHQPIAVLADTDMLESLPERHRRSGLAECIKHALIANGITGADLMTETRAALPGVTKDEPEAIARLIQRSVSLKGEVVRRDERESIAGAGGVRMLLNLGHTFAHAIETLPDLTPHTDHPELAPLHHGEAVALGLLAACRCAESLGLISSEIEQETRALLETAGLPTSVGGLPGSDVVLSRMGSDKKAAGGSFRLVLPEARGRCRVVNNPDTNAVLAGIDAMRTTS